jgi:uncharacterized protein
MNTSSDTAAAAADAASATPSENTAAVDAAAQGQIDPQAEDRLPDPYAEVCWTLAGFDHHLSPEWVDGYLTSVAVMSRPCALDEFLPLMCGDAFDRAFADPSSARQAFDALSARLEAVRAELDLDALGRDPDTLRLDPWLLEIDEAHLQALREDGLPEEAEWTLLPANQWCDGFLAATRNFEDAWAPPRDKAESAYLQELLLTLKVLTLDPASVDFRASLKALEHRETPDRDGLIGDALFSVQSLRLFWAFNAPRGTPRRVEPTPGRNDPCPCGSGRKFKKCHGAG